MDYFGFIFAAYLFSGAVLLALVVWVIADGRAQTKALEELHRNGIRRAGRDEA